MYIRSQNMKKRKRRGDPQKQRYWEEVVRRWKESGASVREYCRGEGLRESAFYCWRRELARRSQSSAAVSQLQSKASPITPAARAPKRQSSQHGGTASFLPVRVVEDATADATRGVEIVLAHGRTVRVGVGFDRQTLAEVLAVLEVRPC
jgi:hypothetical protein